jgi:hypothetical protein
MVSVAIAAVVEVVESAGFSVVVVVLDESLSLPHAARVTETRIAAAVIFKGVLMEGAFLRLVDRF